MQKLRKLVLKPTARCYHRCGYCVPRQEYYEQLFARKNMGRRTTSASELQSSNMPIEMAVRQIAAAYSLGMRECLFSGGDPLLYPSITELVGAASSYGDVFVYINSLGVGIHKSKVLELIEAGLCAWNLSVDTVDPKDYDRIRGVDGAFCRLMETVKILREVREMLDPGRTFFVNYMTVITRQNYQDLPKLLAHAIDNQISSIYFMYVYGDRTGAYLLSYQELQDLRSRIVPEMLDILNCAALPDPVFPNAQEVFSSFYSPDNTDENYARGRWWTDLETAKNSCHIPDYCVHIEPDGTVLPCCLGEISHEGAVGNVSSRTLKDVWEGQDFREFRRSKMSFCLQCPVQRNTTLGLTPAMCRQFGDDVSSGVSSGLLK